MRRKEFFYRIDVNHDQVDVAVKWKKNYGNQMKKNCFFFQSLLVSFIVQLGGHHCYVYIIDC
jgi:hypothetical protein